MNNTTYAPKGGMCANCIHINRKCNHLNFSEMRVIEVVKDIGAKVVKCTDFTKKEK